MERRENIISNNLDIQGLNMKIAQINAVYGILSTGRSAKELSDYLIERGHECITFYGNQKGNYENTVFVGNNLSHKIHAMESRLTGNAGHGSYLATQKLIKQLNRYNPDVIHLRNLHGNFVHIPLLLKFLIKKDIPTVLNLDDCFWFTGGCMHYTVNKCYKWQKGNCKDCKFLKFGENYWLRNNAYNNLNEKIKLIQAIPRLAVCGVSKWIADQARQSPAFKNAKIITHIYNWIDLDVFKPQGEVKDKATKEKLGLLNKKMVLGVAANWEHGKGLEDFIELSVRLPENISIVLVGKIPNYVSLPPNIISVTVTNNVQELAEYYSAADVFVHLSLEETFGKVIAEAMACGTPAIVYDSTALPELIKGKTGIILNAHDFKSITDAIETVPSHPSSECIRQSKESFSLNRNCQNILSIYSDLIQS